MYQVSNHDSICTINTYKIFFEKQCIQDLLTFSNDNYMCTSYIYTTTVPVMGVRRGWEGAEGGGGYWWVICQLTYFFQCFA